LDPVDFQQPRQQCTVWLNHVVLNTGSTWDTKVAKFGEAIGIPNSNPGSLIGLLGLDFGGGTPTSPGNGTLTNIGNSMVTQSFNSKVYQADDSITWTRGRHTLKFGGEYMFDDIKVFYSGNSGELGGMVFGPNFTSSAATNPGRILVKEWQISSLACPQPSGVA